MIAPRNVVEISDSYFLTEPVLRHHLESDDRVQSNGKRKRPANTNLRPSHPADMIAFDVNLLTPTVETIPLDNLELKRNWGPQIYRIQLKTPGTKTIGKLKLTISAV